MCNSPLIYNHASNTFSVESLCDKYQRRSQYLMATIERVARNSKTIVSSDVFRTTIQLKTDS